MVGNWHFYVEICVFMLYIASGVFFLLNSTNWNIYDCFKISQNFCFVSCLHVRLSSCLSGFPAFELSIYLSSCLSSYGSLHGLTNIRSYVDIIFAGQNCSTLQMTNSWNIPLYITQMNCSWFTNNWIYMEIRNIYCISMCECPIIHTV